MEKDVNEDGIVTTAEIIQYDEGVGVKPWLCCEADVAEDCQENDEEPEKCLKEAFDKWLQTVSFGTVSEPKPNVTIEGCVSSDQRRMEEKITVCSGCKWMI